MVGSSIRKSWPGVPTVLRIHQGTYWKVYEMEALSKSRSSLAWIACLMQSTHFDICFHDLGKTGGYTNSGTLPKRRIATHELHDWHCAADQRKVRHINTLMMCRTSLWGKHHMVSPIRCHTFLIPLATPHPWTLWKHPGHTTQRCEHPPPVRRWPTHMKTNVNRRQKRRKPPWTPNRPKCRPVQPPRMWAPTPPPTSPLPLLSSRDTMNTKHPRKDRQDAYATVWTQMQNRKSSIDACPTTSPCQLRAKYRHVQPNASELQTARFGGNPVPWTLLGSLTVLEEEGLRSPTSPLS